MGRILVFTVIASLAATLSGQTPGSPTFEVASVKPNLSDERFGLTFTPGRLTAVNVPLERLIYMAYQMPPFTVVNSPAWISKERFDVLAKAVDSIPPAPRSEMLKMLRALLADRFALSAHLETREVLGSRRRRDR